MIIVRLKGGMGNQMFQYALGRKLATQLNTDLKIDLCSLLDRSKGDFVYRNYDLPIFNVKDQFIFNPDLIRILSKLKSSSVTRYIRNHINKGRKYIKESHFHFQSEYIEAAVDNSIYEGWFQSQHYFQDIESILRKEFSFKHSVLPQSQELLDEIESSNAICLNVRRTDFLKVDNLNTTNTHYFLNAAKYVANQISNPRFFIFSDDVNWCRENIKLDHPTSFIDHSHKGEKFGNYMQLMIACKHFIIPNSSFAWWAVWLNQNEDKIVVAPKKWFNDKSINTTDLVPASWIRF